MVAGPYIFSEHEWSCSTTYQMMDQLDETMELESSQNQVSTKNTNKNNNK
jgi:hypothetical protein